MKGLLRSIARRADTLLTKVLLGVIVGKFAGDLASLYLTEWFGPHAGLQVGLLAGALLFILVPPLERHLSKNNGEG